MERSHLFRSRDRAFHYGIGHACLCPDEHHVSDSRTGQLRKQRRVPRLLRRSHARERVRIICRSAWTHERRGGEKSAVLCRSGAGWLHHQRRLSGILRKRRPHQRMSRVCGSERHDVVGGAAGSPHGRSYACTGSDAAGRMHVEKFM